MLSQISGYDKTFFDETQLTSLCSAREIVPLILGLVDVKSVIDVGCGTGAWLSVFSQFGVSDIQGIDNASLDYDQLQIPANKILRHDLIRPFSLGEGHKADLVSCLEVAEHLPANCAEQIVSNLINLAPLVLFSAAIPHQGGTNHINEQWPEYWANLFAQKGYVVVDCLREKIWQNDNVAYWYAQNLLLYVKAECLYQHPKLAQYIEHTDLNRLTLIHPKTYVKNYDRLHSPAVMVLRFMWSVIPRWLRLRLVKPLNSVIWTHVSTKYRR